VSSTMHTPAATTTHMPAATTIHMPAATTTHVPVATTTTHTTHVARGMPGHQVRCWRACRATRAAAAERAAVSSEHRGAASCDDLCLALCKNGITTTARLQCAPTVLTVCSKPD